MAKEKSKAKKIIIPAVAVILTAAIVVTGYFGWYKPKHGIIQKSGGGSDTKQSVTITPAEVSYETADYKGAKVPKPFVEIFEQAEKDSEAACKKYGTALTVGDCEISETEFGMTYFDMFIYASDDEINDPNGLKPSTASAPAAQAYGDGGATWADRLREATSDALKNRYILFSEALENGFLPSDYTVLELSGIPETIEYNAEVKGVTPDKELAGSYFDGVTVSLYVRNLILRAYADEYETAVTDSFAAAHSDSEIKDIYEQNPSKYNYVDVRVFTIFSEDDEAVERAKKEVTDLDSFYKFGLDYFGKYDSGYADKQEKETRCHFATFDDLDRLYGSSIAEWCFAEGRQAGDVSVVEGIIYNCLIFVEKTQYTTCSVNFYESLTAFNENGLQAQNESEINGSKNAAQSHYDLLKRNNGSLETMKEIADSYNESTRSIDTRGKCERSHVSDMGYNVARWMLSSERKKGDFEVIESDIGYGVYYFDSINKEDTDAYDKIRSNLAEEEFEHYYDSLLVFNGYKTVTNSGVVDGASQKGEDSCARYAEKVSERRSSQ